MQQQLHHCQQVTQLIASNYCSQSHSAAYTNTTVLQH